MAQLDIKASEPMQDQEISNNNQHQIESQPINGASFILPSLVTLTGGAIGASGVALILKQTSEADQLISSHLAMLSPIGGGVLILIGLGVLIAGLRRFPKLH